MIASHAVVGNLALDLTAAPRPTFTVIDGTRTTTASTAPVAAPAPTARLAKRILAACVLGALTIALVSAAWAMTDGRAAACEQILAETPITTISVESGDSLWSLAAEHPVTGLTDREVVEAIRSWNGLERGELHPGMELAVPAA